MCFRGTIVKRVFLVLGFLIVAVGCIALVHKFRQGWILQSAKDHMQDAYSAYTLGTFGGATNELLAYVRYMEEHRQQLVGKLKVDYVLYIAHAKLTLMYAYDNDVTNAYVNLRRAYQYHRMAGLSSVEASNFLDFITTGTEKVDSSTGVAWKAGLEFPTNTISRIRQLPL